MKKFLFILLTLGVLAVIGLGIASWWVMRNLGPEVWVAQAEANWNCRVHIDDADLSLFSKPATLKFKGVSFSPRDAEVDKPFAERAPVAAGTAPIVIPELIWEIKLNDLIERRLFIEKLRIVEPVVNERQDAQGRSSLESLFKKPGAVEDAPVAVVSPEAPVRYQETGSPLVTGEVPRAVSVTPTYAAETNDSAPAESPPPSAFGFAVDTASIENGQLTIVSKDTTVNIRELNFTLTGIDIDPRDLVNHNRMKAQINSLVNVQGMARIGGVKRPAELANLMLEGEADIIPIDVKTGLWNPTTYLKLTLAKGSTLAGHLTIGDAAGKELRQLQEYGVDLSPVRVGGPLLQNAVVDGGFLNNRFSLRVPAVFEFPEYEVVLAGKSWVNAAQDQHQIDLRLSCAAELQQRLQSGIAQAKLGESIARAVSKALSDERGRMTFDIKSSGPLSDPHVRPDTDRVLKNLVRGEGLGDLLQGLLKKL